MGEIVRWTDAPRGMLINPKGEWCSYADVAVVVSDYEQCERELTRQVEQLRAIVKALLNDRPCGSECEYFHHSKKDQHNYCEPCKPILRWEKAVGDALSALTAPPSSSDPGRADTGREER